MLIMPDVKGEPIFIKRHLILMNDGSVQYDFSSEPRSHTPRYCSFFATSVYFLILAALTKLERIGIDVPERLELGQGIVKYVESNLLESSGIHPCIKPNEGPEKFIRNILPHVGESVALKGACLSDWMLFDAKRNLKEEAKKVL